MTDVNRAQLHCPHCGELAPQKIVRQKGEDPLLWCGVCYRVTIVEYNLSLPIDPLPFWSELNVQVSILDADHERLIKSLNELHAAAKAGTLDRLKVVAGHLLEETARHFQREELFLKDCRFPGLIEHQGSHAAVLNELRHFVARVRTAPSDVTELVRAMKFCLVEHLAEDMKYKDHLGRR